MTQVFDVLLNVARLLHGHVELTATGGGTTTIVYANTAVPLAYAADSFNGGTLFFISGNNANVSAPVTDFANTGGTATWTHGTLAANAATNRFVALMPAYPRADLVGALNLALGEIGKVVQLDDTLVGVTDQEEYDIPSGVSDIRQIYVAQSTGAPYDWKEGQHFWWYTQGAHLELYNELPDTGYPIRLLHAAPHAAVNGDTDAIASDINLMRLTSLTLYYLLLTRMKNTGNSDPNAERDLKLAFEDKERLARMYPVRLPNPDPRYGL